jgi:hypothetical protein
MAFIVTIKTKITIITDYHKNTVAIITILTIVPEITIINETTNFTNQNNLKNHNSTKPKRP